MQPVDSTTIWRLTDGKVGDRVQCAGVAAALGGEAKEMIIAPAPVFAWAAPWGPIDWRHAPDRPGSPIAPPFPDILIASGRRAAPYARVVKKESGGRTFVAFLKDPRVTASFADLIWTPAHDKRRGAKVFTTLTAPHGLAAAIRDWAVKAPAATADLPGPILGLVLGGPSGGARYDLSAADQLCDEVAKAMGAFGSIAVTPSRRTPKLFEARVRECLSVFPGFVWEGSGRNPYLEILGRGDALIVAGDSHNMVSEAAASSAGVYVWRPEGMAKKLRWFLDAMKEKGRVRDFAGDATPFDAESMDATREIADEIRRRR
ncbi:MAG: mitochondrial fission ELM1 family protein [Pseudomonadota bacterium]